MKIIQVIPLLGLGGAETMCENLTYALRDLGHEVIIVCLYDYNSPITERMAENKVDIRYLHKKQGLDISLFSKLKNLFVEEKPDVVHTHLYAAKYCFPTAKLAGVGRIVHTIHNVAKKESPKNARILNGFYFRHCGVIPVSLSKLVQDTVVKEYRLDTAKTPVVYNGVNLLKCRVKTDYSTHGIFKILHIGRFFEQKNHAGLIEAFEIFHKKYPNSELQLIGNGELFDTIKLLVESKRLSDAVKFLGQQSEVFDYLYEADIFTLPSNFEGMPMTLIEAMGTGLPIVATAVGGVPDMLDDSCSQLVDVDVQQIAQAFENYYLDEQLRQTHGKKVLNRKEDFSAKKMAQDYCMLYQGTVERR